MMPAVMLGRPSARYSLMQTLAQGLSAGTLLGSSKFLKDKFVFCLFPGVHVTHNDGKFTDWQEDWVLPHHRSFSLGLCPSEKGGK